MTNANCPKWSFSFLAHSTRVYFNLNLKLVKILVDIYVDNNNNDNINFIYDFKIYLIEFLHIFYLV